MMQGTPRRGVRHPRRRRRPDLPAPRERDRAERRRERQWALRPRLDAQRSAQPRQREDVEVAGNFFTIREVLERYDGETLRFFFLRAHYRSALAFRREPCRRAPRCAGSIRRSTRRRRRTAFVLDWSEPRAAAFRAAMDEDFDARGGGRAVRARGRTQSHAHVGDRRPAQGLAGTLGLLQQEPRAHLQAGARGWTRRRSPSASRRAPRRSRHATSSVPTRSAPNSPPPASN